MFGVRSQCRHIRENGFENIIRGVLYNVTYTTVSMTWLRLDICDVSPDTAWTVNHESVAYRAGEGGAGTSVCSACSPISRSLFLSSVPSSALIQETKEDP